MEFDTELLNLAIFSLKGKYSKILIVNLTDDTYKPVIVDSAEWQNKRTNSYSLTAFRNWFVESGFLHEDDSFVFNDFWSKADNGEYVHYRRKKGDTWQWVQMELVATENYTETNKECILYVSESKTGLVDRMTGLLNRHALDRDVSRYNGGTIGVVFVDLNCLKLTNDTKGHDAGDKLILELSNLLKSAFPDYGVYHISGDEFVVLATNVSIRSFLKRAVAWHRWLWTGLEQPLCSVGYSIDVNADSVQDILIDAEKAMYVDKDIFYKRYPELKRN